MLPGITSLLDKDQLTIGEHRLSVVEVLTVFLGLDPDGLAHRIVDSHILEILTVIFFNFPWNSLFQRLYYEVVNLVFSSDSFHMKQALLVKAKLADRI
jgi:hypothetical protein